MILLLKVKKMFLRCFYGNMIKTFHDSINIVVTLGPGQEFFSARYALLSLKSKKLK